MVADASDAHGGSESLIAIADYGLGNLKSIANMLRRAGVDAKVTRAAAEVASADGVILPGVGSFDEGMTRLDGSGLRPALEDHIRIKKKPLLGICLGMQLLGRASDEGTAPGLGWIDFTTERFAALPGRKIPHMGWSEVTPRRPSPLFPEPSALARFYFLHSYVARCASDADVLATTSYGEDFACAVARDNIYGVQFHPEKSHRFGLELLRNFARVT